MRKAISQLFQKKSTSEALSDYLRWRNGIFTVTAAQVDVLTDQPNQVYGVIMDVGHSDEFTITIIAFPTGESSLMTTVGGGVIGLGSNEFIADHAKHIVMLAQSIITTARPINTHDLPKSQKVYFYLLTTSGLMLSETALEVMMNKVVLKEVSPQIHIFREMFARFTEIKTRSEELRSGVPSKIEAIKQHMDAARNHYQQGNFVQAITDYTKAIELEPNNAAAYYNRGIVYSNSGNLEQAIQNFTKAIELDPRKIEAYINRGTAYLDSQDFEKALQDYNKTIALDSSIAEAYNNRGIVYFHLGDLAQAISDYTRAITLDSSYAFAYVNRGNAYVRSGKLKEAIQDFERYLDLAPNVSNREAVINRIKQLKSELK